MHQRPEKNKCTTKTNQISSAYCIENKRTQGDVKLLLDLKNHTETEPAVEINYQKKHTPQHTYSFPYDTE